MLKVKTPKNRRVKRELDKRAPKLVSSLLIFSVFS